jgi:hypothetical protein
MDSPKDFFCFLMIIISILAMGGDIGSMQKATAVLPADAAYLAAAAHVAGASDTNWRTDVELHNIAEVPADATVWLFAHGQGNPEPETVEVLIGPRSSIRLDDVLMSSFGIEDKAALRITTDGGAVVATDRTYNLLGAGNGLGLPDGATFGQYIPLRGAEDAVRYGDEARLIGLAHDETARTNLGLVNLVPNPTRVRAELYLGDGSYLGRVQRELDAFEFLQITGVFELVTGDTVGDGFVVLSTLNEGGAFLADASVVDAITGDPVYVPAERSTHGAGYGAPELWIVAAAHTAGAAGTNWRTDLTVHNPNDFAVDYAVELLLPNTDNSDPQTVIRSVQGGASVRHDDALVELFGADGAAALRIVPDGAPLIAASRTYNLLGPGNPAGLPDGATFGQFIPAVTGESSLGATWTGRLIHLAHDPAGDTGSRTNLVLVNLEESSNAAEVELFRADGWSLGKVDLGLKPREFKQLNRVFERVTDEVVADGYAVVRSTGRSLALASVVDNLTGDPVGMMATRVGDVVFAGSFENAVQGFFEVFGNPDQGGIEQLVGTIQDLGPEGLAGLVAGGIPPGFASANGAVLGVDLGDGMPIGADVLAGTATVDFSGLTIDPDSVEGVVNATCEGCSTNGVDAIVEQLAIEFDLTVRPDDSIVGTIGLDGVPLGKSTTSGLSGHIEIDTAICLYYPIAGQVSFTTEEGAVVTVTFGPDCEGSTTTQAVPAWDWTYAYGSPATDHAHLYIDSLVNAKVTRDVADYWTPEVGGTEFYGRSNPGDTPPGIITYHFGFDRPVEAAYLFTHTSTFNFAYSKGHNYFFASRDGSNWNLLFENPPPTAENDPPKNGHWDDLLPADVLGTTDLWFRVEQYSWGPAAPAGGTNTAQHARWWDGNKADTFKLKVRFEDAGE